MFQNTYICVHLCSYIGNLLDMLLKNNQYDQNILRKLNQFKITKKIENVRTVTGYNNSMLSEAKNQPFPNKIQ